MRILIYGINFFPEVTGIGKYTGELSSYLVEQGHLVKVVTGNPYYPQWRIYFGYSGWKYHHETIQGAEVWRCPLWVPKTPSGITRIIHLFSFAVFSIPIMLLQIFWKPDIILCIVPAITTTPIARFVAWMAHSFAWLHIQDFEIDTALSLKLIPRFGFMNKIIYFIEKSLLDSFDRISTISNQMLNLLTTKGIQPQKTMLFPNWVDEEKIFPLSVTNPLRSAWNIPDEKFIVLYAGSMGQKQGLEVLIDAAKLLSSNKNILFLFVGDGSSKATLELMAKNQPNICFFPLQPFKELNNLLNIANVHVLPQLKNAADLVMPSKLSGMFASGKAVIASAKPDTELGRIVISTGILIPPEDSTALASAILHLYKNPQECEELGIKGRNFMLNHWSKQKILTQFNKDIYSLVQK